MWTEGICIGGWGSHVYALGHLATSSPTLPIKPALALPIGDNATNSLSTRGAPRRNNMAVRAASTAPDVLRKGIAEFYDESSGVWEDIWGDHMHHGFYDPAASDVSISDHRAAQIRMIEQSLAFASLSGTGTPLSLSLYSLTRLFFFSFLFIFFNLLLGVIVSWMFVVGFCCIMLMIVISQSSYGHELINRWSSWGIGIFTNENMDPTYVS